MKVQNMPQYTHDDNNMLCLKHQNCLISHKKGLTPKISTRITVNCHYLIT